MEIITTDDEETLVKCGIERLTRDWVNTFNVDGEPIYLSRNNIEIVSRDIESAEILIPNWLARKVGIL